MIDAIALLRLPGAIRLEGPDWEFRSMNKCLRGVVIG